MSLAFEELAYCETPLGPVSLRRRRVPMLDNQEIHEVKLGDEFLMSSLFHDVEVALADLGLADREGPLDVVVGGLGLGYTARAALRNPHVRSLLIVEALEPVIDWHRAGLVPLGPELTSDGRTQFVLGDFFALATSPDDSFDPSDPRRTFDAVLLDIDHSPDNLLHPRHAAFYTAGALREFAKKLNHGGTFALWSDDPPEKTFLSTLREVFAEVTTQVVTFPNPLRGTDSASTVYLAKRVTPSSANG
ncbi:MAG: hypothetical protein WA771_07010 [Chthoniobacterales bacterium]